jgi:hypothetical protein
MRCSVIESVFERLSDIQLALHGPFFIYKTSID